MKLLPSTVEDAYAKSLGRLSEGQGDDVEKVSQIVVGRPGIQEVAIALGIATSTQPVSLEEAALDPVLLEKAYPLLEWAFCLRW